MSPTPIRLLRDGVDGYLHQVEHQAPTGGIVLTHGAGANCQTPLLIALANAFTGLNFAVLRCDLPFRQHRRSGPPFPAQAAADREGLRQAVEALRRTINKEIYIGGHSYGGRQASMLAAEQPELVSGLLLLSYPLHPPNKPDQLRTAHFPLIRTTCTFVHGTKDPFASIDELMQALDLIPGPKSLLEIEGAGHDLKGGKIPARRIALAFSTGHSAVKSSVKVV